MLQRLSAAGAADVYATDAILAAIMVASRSVYSWDVTVRKEGGKERACVDAKGLVCDP